MPGPLLLLLALAAASPPPPVEGGGAGDSTAATGRIEEIEVRARRLDREADRLTGFVTLDRETTELLPALGEQDPIRALQWLPGVQTASDISSGLYVRGGSPDQTLILLDDVTVYNPTHAFGLFSTFNTDVVDEVRLYKGAYPARYGGRLGSVLEVRQRATDGAGFSGRGGVSTITGRLLLEGPAGRGSWMVGGRRTYLEPILDALRNEDNEIPSYYFYDLNGRLVVPAGRGSQFSVTGYAGRDDLFLDLDEDSFLDIRWGNRTASGQLRRPLGQAWTGTLLLSGSEYESRTDLRFFTTPFSFRNRLREGTLRADLVGPIAPRHRLSTGASVAFYDFLYRESFNFDEQARFRSRPTDVSLYVEDEWSPGPVSTAIGARGRYFSEGRRFLLEPRLSASWAVDERTRLKIGGGLYHQYVQLVTTEGFSAGDFYLPVDSSADPGRSLQAVVGVERTLSPAWDVSVEGFATKFDELLALDNLANADRTVQTTADAFLQDGTGWSRGAEVLVRRKTGALTGWVGYTLGWTRRRFAELNGGEEFPPKYDRRHDLSVTAGYRTGRWRFGSAFVYATGQAFTPATARYRLRNPATGADTEGGRVLAGPRNSGRLGAYQRLDVSITRDFLLLGRPAEGYLQVFNVTNRRNEWFVQYDTEGIDDPEVVRMLPIIPSLGIRFGF